MSAWSLDSVPLEQMTLKEKLSLIELVWESLTQKDESTYASPNWHGKELQTRLDSAQSGVSKFDSLENVRERLKR